MITGEPDAMCDSSAEWFPALTERESLSTLQGREWILGKKFGEFIGRRINLQNCIDEGMGCLNNEAEYFGTSFDYVYISIKTPTNNCKAAESSSRISRGLIIALENSIDYSIVYKSRDAIIFDNIK